jgi:hypothetical protein
LRQVFQLDALRFEGAQWAQSTDIFHMR